ncbi:FeoC-like transcriptional regulator [Methylobacter sp.]|uniref:FeoC-like transcriptional regulator n=1 Tax=Methylobacter sp. TaxID=2051955 RepID=UPI002FDCC2F3
MILSNVSHYLRQHRRASLDDIAQGTGSTPEAIAAMLATLERKGRVQRLPIGSSCGASCCKCDPAKLAIYEWTGENRSGDKGDK